MTDDTPGLSFDDYESAMRARDAIRTIAQAVVDQYRPLPRYATTASGLNIFTNKIFVTMNGGTTQIPATMTRSNYPVDIGSIVRVEGTLNNLYITEVMNGRPGFFNPVLTLPYIAAGTFGGKIISNWLWAQSVGMPSLGQCAWIGRWEASELFQNVGGVIEIAIYWNEFGTHSKLYRIPMNFNMTQGAWVKIFPTEDSGSYNGWDVGLEIAIDGSGFELRARQYGSGSGLFSPGVWQVIIRALTAPFKQVISSLVTTSPTDTIPSAALNVLTTNVLAGTATRGHLQSPPVAALGLSQTLMHGGGLVTYNADAVNNFLLWTDRFSIFDLGNNELAPGNGFSIPVPGANVNVPVFCHATQTSRSTTVGGIQLLPGEALYYELPLGQGSINAGHAGDPSFMRIISNGNTSIINQQVPAHWILVARVSQDVSHGSVKMGTGETIDSLRRFIYEATWSDVGGVEELGGYRKVNGQVVLIQGSFKSTVALGANATSTTVTILPINFRPARTRRFVALLNLVPLVACKANLTAAGALSVLAGQAAPAGSQFVTEFSFIAGA